MLRPGPLNNFRQSEVNEAAGRQLQYGKPLRRDTKGADVSDKQGPCSSDAHRSTWKACLSFPGTTSCWPLLRRAEGKVFFSAIIIPELPGGSNASSVSMGMHHLKPRLPHTCCQVPLWFSKSWFVSRRQVFKSKGKDLFKKKKRNTWNVRLKRSSANQPAPVNSIQSTSCLSDPSHPPFYVSSYLSCLSFKMN